MAIRTDDPHPAHRDGRNTRDPNLDPITGTPGAHPIGTGLGAAGAGAAGAVIGAAAGPLGAIAGAAVGAVVGGLAGKGAAEVVNPTVEDAYWRESFGTRPYVPAGTEYQAWRPAFEYGWTSRGRFRGRTFEEVEEDLGADWEMSKYNAELKWDEAKNAARDAWERVERGGERGI